MYNNNTLKMCDKFIRFVTSSLKYLLIDFLNDKYMYMNSYTYIKSEYNVINLLLSNKVIYNSLIDTYMSHDYFPWLAIAKRNIIPNKRQNLIKKIIFDSPKMLKDELISSFPNIKKLEFGLEYTHPLHPGS